MSGQKWDTRTELDKLAKEWYAREMLDFLSRPNPLFEFMKLHPGPKPTRFRRFTYWAWRRHWWRLKDWVCKKICNCYD